jgi:hypothetical protein
VEATPSSGTVTLVAVPRFKGCVFISIMGIRFAKILVIFAKKNLTFT